MRNQLTWAVLPADGVALLNTHRAAAAGDLATVLAIDRVLHALKLPAELRAASCQAGRRLLAETSAFVSDAIPADYRAAVSRGETPGSGAVALGVAAWALGIPAEMALLGFCHGYAVGVLGAAMRLLPLTHSQAQGILFRLHPLLADLAQEIATCPWQEMTAFTPEVDLAALGHEDDDLRMFAS
ncbi:MAG: urease accessory protein UreF [Chloroflexi bacterium]|nr:urease accessory protein UreF [Chloroflexota bacterium]